MDKLINLNDVTPFMAIIYRRVDIFYNALNIFLNDHINTVVRSFKTTQTLVFVLKL